MSKSNLQAFTLILPLFIIIVHPSPSNGISNKCGYESCPKIKEGFVNIHLVPHSHDDVGWLKTVDEYYYGANNSIQLAGVQYILDSVVEELSKVESRKFIYVETSFFWRWWKNQNIKTKDQVRKLVNSGQLEFISGGWSMNDEATSFYNEIIDQMTLGLRFLNDTFGSCGVPKVGWQIDPFGHSREEASILAQMGFDGLFFGRLDYQDKEKRKHEKNMEMLWSGSPNDLGKGSFLFTGALFNGYNPPNGFCFDVTCGDDPLMDDPQLLGYNLPSKIASFLNASAEWSSAYRSSHVLMTMGSDFQYMAAGIWYKNLDKLIEGVNGLQANGSKVNLIYSTPSCYLQEVNKASLTWDVKRDDFFPYASDPHAFWTGYFTSRPSLKLFVHESNNLLQICKQFLVFEKYGLFSKSWELSEGLGIAQHHDAVAGTAKQHVSNDYALRLSRGIEACEKVIGQGIKFLKESSNTIVFCNDLNITSCQITESSNKFIVNVYNSLGRTLEVLYVKIPTTTKFWKVYDSEGNEVEFQVERVPEVVFNIPGRLNSTAFYEIIFTVSNIEPFTIREFKFERQEDVSANEIPRDIEPNSRFLNPYKNDLSSKILTFENSKGVRLTLNKETGLITSIARMNLATGKITTVRLSQNFYFYQGMAGNNKKFNKRASGAYIFRPNGSEPIQIANKVKYTVSKGNLVTQIRQVFSSWLSQVISLYNYSDAVEFEWIVGPIPIEDGIGKEIITRFSSDLNTRGEFFTDANGRELLKRKKNFRPTWSYRVHEEVSGNYYPVNSRIILSESELLTSSSGKTLILLNDRAQGGTSLKDGQMELMIHRRLLHDDAFGVGEALNETEFGEGLVVRGKHWLILAGGDTGVPISSHRLKGQEIYRKPLLSFEPYLGGEIKNVFGDKSLYGGLLRLPPNIHLLTLEKLREGELLLRLEHFYQKNEDEKFSQITPVSVQMLKESLKFVKMRETTLGGNVWRDESSRLKWSPNENIELTEEEKSGGGSKIYEEGDEEIELKPMEIRTFILYLN